MSAWRDVIAAAGDVYPETLHFGVHRVGFSNHWKEELERLEAGFEQIKTLPRQPKLDAATRQRMLRRIDSPTTGKAPIRLQRAVSAKPNQDLLVTASVQRGSHAQLTSVRLRYRHVTQFEDYQSIQMAWDPQRELYTAKIPGRFIVPEWDLMYFVEVINRKGQGWKTPDLETEAPYVIVPVDRQPIS